MKLQELMENDAENEKIKQELEVSFPDMWFKDGALWNKHAAAWSGEGSYIKDDSGEKVEAFNYNSWEFDPKEETWKMGIHKKLYDFVEERGYHWEANDPGTYILYKD